MFFLLLHICDIAQHVWSLHCSSSAQLENLFQSIKLTFFYTFSVFCKEVKEIQINMQMKGSDVLRITSSFAKGPVDVEVTWAVPAKIKVTVSANQKDLSSYKLLWEHFVSYMIYSQWNNRLVHSFMC